jgi:hypothetical protein
MIERTGVDEKILVKIDELRAKYRACTARHLAGVVGVHHTHVSARLWKLKEAGLVDFDAKVPGSIHRVGTYEGYGAPSTEVAKVVEATAPREIHLGVDPDRAAAAIARRQAAKVTADQAAAKLPPKAPRKAAGTKKAPATKR